VTRSPQLWQREGYGGRNDIDMNWTGGGHRPLAAT
jgi:hypothetical protein